MIAKARNMEMHNVRNRDGGCRGKEGREWNESVESVVKSESF